MPDETVQSPPPTDSQIISALEDKVQALLNRNWIIQHEMRANKKEINALNAVIKIERINLGGLSAAFANTRLRKRK